MWTKRNFVLSMALNVLQGGFLFVVVFYVPMFYQIVRGLSATNAGLFLLPTVGAAAISTIVSGILVSRTGRYRLVTMAGMVLGTVGVGLLVLWHKDTPTALQIVFPLIAGLGFGLTIQTTVTTAQSQLALDDLAVGTAAANFFRTVGGVFGLGIMQSIFNNVVTRELINLPFGDVLVDLAKKGLVAIEILEPESQQVIIESYFKALHTVYIATVPFCGAAVLVAMFLREVPLSSQRKHEPMAGGNSGECEEEKHSA
ncbi:MFS general substrate transporter [Ramicandelaber brevisporus]|nr:MFS general substrate transporter [Ramicandelaber brevisporus]